jgi:hypothetical protein
MKHFSRSKRCFQKTFHNLGSATRWGERVGVDLPHRCDVNETASAPVHEMGVRPTEVESAKFEVERLVIERKSGACLDAVMSRWVSRDLVRVSTSCIRWFLNLGQLTVAAMRTDAGLECAFSTPNSDSVRNGS